MSHENIVYHPEKLPRFYDHTKTLAHRSFNPALRKNIKKTPSRVLYYWRRVRDGPRHCYAMLVPRLSFANAHRHASACLSIVVEPLLRGSNPALRKNIKKTPSRVLF